MKNLLLSKINTVMLYVKDLEGTSKWYCENLGFSLRKQVFNEYAELHIDGQYAMHLFKSEQAIPIKKAVFALETPDVDLAHHLLDKQYVEVLPIEDFGDNRSFRFKDIEGNVLIMTEWLNKVSHSLNKMEQTEVSNKNNPLKTCINNGITSIVHYVNDLESASKWYVENLGFALGDFDFNDYVELYLEDQYILNLTKTNEIAPHTQAYFSFNTSDIKYAHQTLNEKGIEVYPIVESENHLSFYFRDLEGNMLLITQ